MSRTLFLFATIVLVSTLQSQKKSSIELEISGRYDKHADYTTRYFSRSYTNDTKLWGKSVGVGVNYTYLLVKHFNAQAGVRYYNLGVDEVRQTTPFNIIASGRAIDYRHPLGIQPLFSTEKYHYNNLTFNAGFNYVGRLSNKMDLVAGSNFIYLYSFSQMYQITYDIRFKNKNRRSLGVMVNTALGVSYKFHQNKNYISAKAIVPIYQRLKGDPLFGEDGSVNMHKWLNGLGLSIAVGKYF